jgi:beta-carotene 15,15'-dioxygenase
VTGFKLPVRSASMLVGFFLGLVWWLDHSIPQAGMVALLLLTTSVGLFHGALDTVILLQKFHPASRALAWAAAYLIAVVALGAVFAQYAAVALALLLVLSAWHFGEVYGRWNFASEAGQALARVVVGGAPVVLPVVASADQLHAFVQTWFDADHAWLWVTWQALVWVWFGLLAVWLVRYAWNAWHVARIVITEVIAVAVLNFALSPLMAFALYFGLYHAVSHIGRVVRATASPGLLYSPAVLLTLCLTLVLSAALWWWLGPQGQGALGFSQAQAVQWLVVALLALTAPHMVLVSSCARWLATGSNAAAQ